MAVIQVKITGLMRMNFNFSFYWFYGTVDLDWNLNFLPSKQSPLRDFIAFLNGGVRDGSCGYWFISDEGLLHFALLTNQLDTYEAQWRLRAFSYHEIRQNSRNNDWF
jgi:hypothetical protein